MYIQPQEMHDQQKQHYNQTPNGFKSGRNSTNKQALRSNRNGRNNPGYRTTEHNSGKQSINSGQVLRQREDSLGQNQ
jgi:hypothetical protein